MWHKMFWLVRDLMTCLCLPTTGYGGKRGERGREDRREGGRHRKRGRGRGEREGQIHIELCGIRDIQKEFITHYVF